MIGSAAKTVTQENSQSGVGEFATLSLLIFKQLGIGLAVAVLIDATLVRGVLLPATMKLLGDWNWYLPGWLEWLPHVGPGDGRGLPPDTSRPQPEAHPV